MKTAQICGASLLIFTVIAWAVGSIFPYLAARRLSQNLEYINDSDQFFHTLIALLLWALFMLVEILNFMSFFGGACDMNAVMPLVAWVGWAIATLISEAIPFLFRN